MRRSHKRAFGFTLIELMVTIAIAAILLTVAVPSFTTYLRNAELTSASNNLIATINTARGEAMKRNRRTMVVPTSNGTDWTTGWVVFVDLNGNNSYDSATDLTVTTKTALPSYLSVTGTGSANDPTAPYIMFDASGYAAVVGGGFGGLTLSISRNDVTGSQLVNETRRIKIGRTGRVRSCKPVSATDAQCSTSSTD